MLGKTAEMVVADVPYDHRMHTEVTAIRFPSPSDSGIEMFTSRDDEESGCLVYAQMIPKNRRTVHTTYRFTEGGDIAATADYSSTENAGLAARYRHCLGLGPEWGAMVSWLDVNGRTVLRFEIPPIDLHGVIAEIERAEEERLRLPEKAAFDDGGDYE